MNMQRNMNTGNTEASPIRIGLRKSTDQQGRTKIDAYVLDINVPRSNRLNGFFDDNGEEKGVQVVAKSGLHSTHFKFGTTDPDQFVRLVNRLLTHVDPRSLR